MKKTFKFITILIIIINCLSKINKNNLQDNVVNDEEVLEINEIVLESENYLKAEFYVPETETYTYTYFKYENSTLPSSKITAFKIDFDQFSALMADYKVYCTNVASSTSDSELINILKGLTLQTSSCIEGFRSYLVYDGIVKLDEQKTKLGIVLISKQFQYYGRVYLRIAERVLGTDESRPMEEETFSLVPFTVNIPQFRALAKSKILFYSYSRVLQMFYADSDTPYPEKLFSGNVLSVYTNPNMVRQKYHGASTMVLITNPFGFYSNSNPNLKEEFKFEVKLFESNYLLDYYVSSNSQGRPINSPLLINMTECTSPYYVILNYNQDEDSKTLVIDQIYGKLSYLSVATKFTKSTWDEMLANDMDMVDIQTRKYTLPSNSLSHMDVYQIECQLPLMLNFYYVEDSALHEKMNYGDVSIFTLRPYENANIPFFSSVMAPNIVIEIFNPENDPIVIIEAQEETVYRTNILIEITPMTLSNGITIKERGGFSDTRIIIKVGYSNRGWIDKTTYIKYNSEHDIYLFEFPNDDKRYNYTMADLITSGTNSEDNVKYCFTTNIGGALKPSSENCYRVSRNNPYTLKAYNPLIMYKDYEYDVGLSYYITFKAETEVTSFNVDANVQTYNTTLRNYEGVNNKITIGSTGEYSSILTPPQNHEPAIFIQVQVCDNENSIKYKILKPLTGEVVIDDTPIEKGTKNSYLTFENTLIDTQFLVTGNQNTDVFVRMVGLSTIYVPSFNTSQQISFDSTTNTLRINSPLTREEPMKYTVLVDKDGVISSKKFTLCSFVGKSFDSLALYSKTVTTIIKLASIQINFGKVKMNPGENFEAIVYAEQQGNTQMAFLSNIYSGTVGQIDIETIHEINEVYTLDENYTFTTITASRNEPSYYFSFLPSEVLSVPVGAFRIELDQSASGSFTGVACTFVDNETDPMSMIEAVEGSIEDDTSYCVGSQSAVNPRKYNYIFKYEYKDETTPKRLVIKVSNGNFNVEGNFNIYMKQDQGVKIERTDYEELREYGKDENNKKSVIPYIVDVYTLRGEDTTDYVSKVLFYSQHLEMQMYYIPTNSNKPIKLFCGNIALVYTNPLLAEQKYHATTLVLISENLEGEEHPSIGESFRFHTKMFKSDAQVEFYVSQNPDGRTLNFPLSLEMNTCTSDNNKLYYILNYNKPEEERILHLDMIFGSYLRARIAREINAQTWNQLIEQSMDTIDNYQINLPQKSQHIDVIEIQCNSPLLLNAYYSYDNYEYNIVKEGEIVVKEILPLETVSFGVEKGSSPIFFYSISLFNPNESPDVTVRFSDGNEYSIKGNALDTGILMFIPERVRILSNTRTKTRLIFKIGYGVDSNEDWQKEEYPGIDGTLYSQGNKFVYKFPNDNNEYNFTRVDLTVKSLNDDDENVKFCYSTNLGIAIDTSRENCFRTGKRIPYTLSFINPLIVGKNYKVNTDKYYISLRPFEEKDYLKITIVETKYLNLNRNEEGVPKQLALVNGEAGSILSLPKEESTNVIVQVNTCTKRENILEYQIYNAFTKEYYKNGKVYEVDVNGVYDIIPNGYLENEIKLLGVSDTNVFIKHNGLGKDYTPTILKDYSVTFDEETNEAIIVKPIYNEEFTFTVLVNPIDTLKSVTQCQLAFGDRSKLARYVNTFTSVSSNIITHFIDFNELGYSVGTEFDLLVYAEQTKNSKMEFLYKVVSGKVGKISGVLGITEFVDNEYVSRTFRYNIASNYLYYDFTRKPLGNIASLKIKTVNSKVSKVGCVFTSPNSDDNEMVRLVNKAVLEGTNACIGEMQGDSDGYDALINANYGNDNNRLVIQVLYGLGEEKDKKINEDEENNIINIKFSGTSLGTNEGKFGTNENNAPIPYVINLLEIRDSNPSDYVSKVLLYSNTREMEMFYIDDNSPAPVSLFTGNIMMIYTNPELINQKYHGATTMILITDSLSSTDKPIIGEEYRFMVKHFNSAANIQYFLSSNPEGRPLNNPTTIEMTSCSQPYYYILNYNKAEEVRKLHIDTIFGEKDTIKLATALNADTWDFLISSMDTVDGDEVVLESQLDTRNQYHFDVIEVKCKLPLLLNLFYVDPSAIKVNGLELGDISIFSLGRGQEQTLNFKTGPDGFYVYSFNILKSYNQKPNIEIVYNGGQTFQITENGVYPKYSMIQYESILVRNKDNTGATNTRIIFKFGNAIEYSFEGIENNIYSNQNDKNRTDNLYGYIYNHTNAKLNYTGVDFTVSTTEDNVKFCYSTNLGTFINPSLQNCYRVGKNNPYTISTLNPLVMYRDYYSDDNLFYYVGFRTVELNQKITITPIPKMYDTTERNLEGEKNKVTLPFIETYSTILTPPKNNEPYIFTHIHVCSRDRSLSYEFLNAYDSTNLGFNGEIQANSKFHFISVDNTKLDTKLVLKGKQAVEVFIKHVGISSKYQPIVKDIEITYNKETREINWTQPIENELFEYTIYIDKINILNRLGYTLCDIAEVSKLGHYSESLTTNVANPKIDVPNLGADYENFDVLIVAEQVGEGKITILSDVYDSEGNRYKPQTDDSTENSNLGLIILIIILSVAIIVGAIVAFILYRKYKSEGEVQKKNKETSMALIDSAKNDKLIESRAQESNQIDP